MCCFLPLDGKKKDNLWTHHFAGRENSDFLFSFLFFFQQRITLKEIIIMNKCRSMIEVEQSLKQSQSRYNQGL